MKRMSIDTVNQVEGYRLRLEFDMDNPKIVKGLMITPAYDLLYAFDISMDTFLGFSRVIEDTLTSNTPETKI